jgi:ribonuclease J
MTNTDDYGIISLRDRKHLAQDGMIVVLISLSSVDGSLISGPDIMIRGCFYIRETEELIQDLKAVVIAALRSCTTENTTDIDSLKSTVKNELSAHVYKITKRRPIVILDIKMIIAP